MNLIEIVVVIIGVIFILAVVFKAVFNGRLLSEISKTIVEGNQEKYKKLIFSNSALFLLNPSMVNCLRFEYYVVNNDFEKALYISKFIKANKLNSDDAIKYFSLMMDLSVKTLNKDINSYVISEMEKYNKKSNSRIISALIRQAIINDKLYLNYDPVIIEELRELYRAANSENSKFEIGLLLSKAYHYNGEDEGSKNILDELLFSLSDPLYIEIIKKTLNDLSLLD